MRRIKRIIEKGDGHFLNSIRNKTVRNIFNIAHRFISDINYAQKISVHFVLISGIYNKINLLYYDYSAIKRAIIKMIAQKRREEIICVWKEKVKEREKRSSFLDVRI